jgi:hypothetical protein
LAVVQPATFLRRHRQGFRLFWRWKSRAGRPLIPADLQALIRCIARDNPSWGEERIANELQLKLGLRVSPRTVRKYMPSAWTPVEGSASPPSAGGRLSATMRRPSSPATFAWWSRSPFGFSMWLS